MADNIRVAPSAAGKDIAADDISDVLHQRVKVQFGEDGSATDVSATDPMPVTIDATDVVSVDDNGGSLTVDGTVAATQSGTWNVGTVATVTNPVAVTDNGGSLTVDGTVTAATGATNAAAAAGEIFPAAVRRVDTVTDLADGAVGYARGTRRQAVMTAADSSYFSLTPSVPVPTGSDITRLNSVALTSADFDIRDTSNHFFVIPMASAGWRRISIGVRHAVAAWDQTITLVIYHSMQMANAARETTAGRIGQFTLATNASLVWTISGGATGQGGTIGGASTTDFAHYEIPAIDFAPFVTLQFSASVAPTTGGLQVVRIHRST
jgi:hypothetical protein